MLYKERKIIAGEGFSGNFLTAEYYLDVFQNIAGDHGEEMGVGLDYIRKNYNAFWVVSKTKIVFDKDVEKGEEVILKTFPSSVKPIRVTRDYLIENLSGEQCIKASSEWCVLDLETKGLRKMSSIGHPEIKEFYGNNGITFERFDNLSEENAEYCIKKVLDEYIDKNNHTNNVAYVKMMLDCFSEKEKEKLKISALEIHFIAQSFLGDDIKVCKYQTGKKEFYFCGSIDERKIFEAKLQLK